MHRIHACGSGTEETARLCRQYVVPCPDRHVKLQPEKVLGGIRPIRPTGGYTRGVFGNGARPFQRPTHAKFSSAVLGAASRAMPDFEDHPAKACLPNPRRRCFTTFEPFGNGRVPVPDATGRFAR